MRCWTLNRTQLLFFFSSRRRHTRWPRDWSSDVCSSDLSDTQGGSTLTQQYVKNALLMDAVQRGDQDDINAATEQSYGRKLREAKLAISLEKQWSKDEILGDRKSVV